MELPSGSGLSQLLNSSFLFGDVFRQTLTMMPLTQFQEIYDQETKHTLTYAERYKAKYGKDLEKIEGTTFDNEEDHYLFCSFWYHGEVGYRSHLLAPIFLCLNRVIDIEDDILWDYFTKRTSIHDWSIFVEYAIIKKRYRMLKLINTQYHINYSEGFNQWQLPEEAAEFFLDTHNQQLAFANLPLSKLPTIEELLLSTVKASGKIYGAVKGLILSGDPDKHKMAREYFLRFEWRENFGNSFVGYCAVNLRDLELFKIVWLRTMEKIKDEKDEEEIISVKLKVLCRIIICGTMDILLWLEENYPDFYSDLPELDHSYDYDQLDYDPFDYRFAAQPMLEVLNHIIVKYPNIEEHDVACYVWIRNNDIKAFDHCDHCAGFLPVNVALAYSSEDFIRRFCQHINQLAKDYPEADYLVSVDYKTAFRLFDFDLNPLLIVVDGVQDLKYPEFEEMAKMQFSVSIYPGSFFAPTPTLCERAKSIALARSKLSKEDTLAAVNMAFTTNLALKLFPDTKEKFNNQVFSRNFEYIRCKAELHRNTVIPCYFTQEDLEMESFLQQFDITMKKIVFLDNEPEIDEDPDGDLELDEEPINLESDEEDFEEPEGDIDHDI